MGNLFSLDQEVAAKVVVSLTVDDADEEGLYGKAKFRIEQKGLDGVNVHYRVPSDNPLPHSCHAEFSLPIQPINVEELLATGGVEGFVDSGNTRVVLKSYPAAFFGLGDAPGWDVPLDAEAAQRKQAYYQVEPFDINMSNRKVMPKTPTPFRVPGRHWYCHKLKRHTAPDEPLDESKLKVVVCDLLDEKCKLEAHVDELVEANNALRHEISILRMGETINPSAIYRAQAIAIPTL
ncbi:MAG: hypothetical protein SGILL_008339, partial [Bacillariaceae sp.]